MTMDTSGVLEAARDAYARRDWPRARDGFEAARASGALTADDVYALAESAWWLGLVDDALAYYEEAYRRHLGEGRPRQAAMSAIAAAVSLFLRGDTVVGSGWISRAQRLLQNADGSVEQGWMIHIFEVEAALEGPDPDAVIASARRVQDIGRRGADPSLVALATVGEGRALIRQGRVPQGMALLDEAMLATLSEEVDPATAGNIYCHLMSACQELADLHRMETWTRATADWCERLPAAVLFMGICRVHRAQLLHARGSWDHAEKEAIRVCEDLSDIHTASVAEARYAIGEIHRLRGDLAGADQAYRHAHRLGRNPQPGLALLRLAQDRTDGALASIAAALEGTTERLARARLRAAQVDIALAAAETATARLAGEELDEIAGDYATSGLQAMAHHARGAVLLTEGHTGEALETLQTACRLWRDLHVPYEVAPRAPSAGHGVPGVGRLGCRCPGAGRRRDDLH
jgi:tetratricopeptide (TPR) repeat protein